MKIIALFMALFAFIGETLLPDRRHRFAKRKSGTGLFGRFRISKARVRKMQDIDVELISLVEDPATSLPIIMKAKGGSNRYQLDFSVIQKDKSKSEIYATVYQPDDVDYHNDFTDAEEIAKMAHRFISKGRQANVDIEHDGVSGAGTVVESFILKGEDPRFPAIKSGSWCVVIKMSDRAKKFIDKINGVSMYGTCKYAKSADGTNVIMKGNGEFLRELRIASDVGDTEMAKVLGLPHSDYLSVENGDNDFEFTGDVLKSIAKKVKKSTEEVAAMALNGFDGSAAPAAEAPAEDPADPADGVDESADDTEQTTKNKSMNIRKEKGMLRSGVVPTGGTDDKIHAIAKSAKPSNEDIQQVAKSIFGLSGRSTFRKDNIDSESIAYGGSLSPSVATNLISLIVDDSTLLGKVSVERVRRPKGEIDVADLSVNTARRKTAGSPPGTGDHENVINKSLQYECKEMDITYIMEKKMLRDYAGDMPGLETKMLMDFFVPSMRNQMLSLGFIGTSDTYVDTFESLGKGWLQVARDKCPGAQVLDISALALDSNDPQEIMAAMKAALLTTNPRFYTPELKYLLASLDYHKYGEILKARPDGMLAVVNGADKKYDGHEILSQNLQPSTYYLLSHLDNMKFIVQIADGQADGMAIERNPVQKGTEVILTAAVDYEFVNPLGVVTVKP